MRISDWSSDVCSSDLWNQLNRRMHTKLLLVDGVVGITGGRNYQDDYYDWDDEFNFSDRDLLVAGPVAREMATNFDAFWDRTRVGQGQGGTVRVDLGGRSILKKKNKNKLTKQKT